MVEHLTLTPKEDSSNPATGCARNGNKKNIIERLCLLSIVVVHLTHILKIEGSNPITGTGREKMNGCALAAER